MQTQKELAEKATIGETTVSRRIAQLKSAGVIRAFRAVLDPAHPDIGFGVTAILRVKLTDMSVKAVLEEKIVEISQVLAVYSVFSPDTDYIALVRAKSNSDLETLSEKIRTLDGAVSVGSMIAARILKETTVLELDT